MRKCKTKAIQTGLVTFRHNQTYPGIIQAYSKPCVTLAYLEPWYIQNPDIFRTNIKSTIQRTVYLAINLLLERNQSNGFASSPLFVPYSERSLFSK